MANNLVENLSLAAVAPQPARPANTRTLNEVATFARTLQNLAGQEAGPDAARRNDLPPPAQRPVEKPVQPKSPARPQLTDRPERPEQSEQKPVTPVAQGRAERPENAAPVERGATVTKPEQVAGEGKPQEPPRAQVTLPVHVQGQVGSKETEAQDDAEASLPLTDLVAELAATVVLPPTPELAQTVSLTQQVDTQVTDALLVATEGNVSFEELVTVAEPTGEGETPVLLPVEVSQDEEVPADLVELVEDTVVATAPVVGEAQPELVSALQVEDVVKEVAPLVTTDLVDEAPEVPVVQATAPVDEVVTDEVVELPVAKAPEIVQEVKPSGDLVIQAAYAPVEPPAESEQPRHEVKGKPDAVPVQAEGPRVELAAMKELVARAKEDRPETGEGRRGIGETVSDFAKTKSIEHLLKPLRGEVVTERGPQVQQGPDRLPAQAKADPLQALVEQGKTVLLTVKPEKVLDTSPVQAMVETVAKAGDLVEQEQGLEIRVEGANDPKAVAVQVGADGAGDDMAGQDQAKYQMASAKEIASHIKIGNDAKVTAYSDRDVIQQVIERIKQAVNAGKSEVRLRLNPESLGEVHVRIISHQGQVTVRLLTDNPEVQKLVESGMGHLRSALAEQGVKVNQLHVTHAQEDQRPGQEQQREHEQPKDERREKRQDREGVALSDFASMLAKEG